MKTNRAEHTKYELYLKENIIKKLQEKGYKLNANITIDNYEDKRFFAFKTLDCTEEQLNNGVKMASYTLRNFFAERQYEHIDFNIVRLESLTDRDDSSELWRGILVTKPSEKVEEKSHITNYEKIKNMTVEEMANLIICAVTSKCLANDCANCMLEYLCNELTEEDNEQEIVTQWLRQEAE